MASVHRNGVPTSGNGVGAHANALKRPFIVRLRDSLPGRLEMLVAIAVVTSVFSVAWLIFNFPGPLVVQAQDDKGEPVMGARITCTDAPESGPAKKFAGITDVFGEAKWPGLEKGMWFCTGIPPDRFQGVEQDGSAQVRSRSPATVRLRFDRPVQLAVEVMRPHGSPRAAIAVLAYCPATPTAPEAAWEARASILSGNTTLWLPYGRECRAGVVKPSLPAKASAGLAPSNKLDCDHFPCTGLLSGNIGQLISQELAPTAEQWEAARPPIEPDEPAQ